MKIKSCFRASVVVSLSLMLLTVVAWDHYFNSSSSLNPIFFSTVILVMGTLFSALMGFSIWLIEKRKDELESQLKRSEEELIKAIENHQFDDAATVAVFWLSQVIFSKPNVEALLETTMELVKRVLNADEGSLMLMDEDGKLYIAQSTGIPRDVARKTRVRLGERVAGKIAQLRREFLLHGDLKKYPQFENVESNPKIKSSIGCPLICHDHLLGVINLNRTSNSAPFGEPDLRYAMIFASQIAQVLWNAKLDQSIGIKKKQLQSIQESALIMRSQMSSS